MGRLSTEVLKSVGCSDYRIDRRSRLLYLGSKQRFVSKAQEEKWHGKCNANEHNAQGDAFHFYYSMVELAQHVIMARVLQQSNCSTKLFNISWVHIDCKSFHDSIPHICTFELVLSRFSLLLLLLSAISLTATPPVSAVIGCRSFHVTAMRMDS